MSIWTDSIFYRELMKRTSIFNLRLYVVICVIAGFVLVLLFVICLLCCCCRSTSRKSKKSRYKQSPPRNSSQNQVSQPPPLLPQPPPPPPSLEEFPPAQKEIAVDIGFHQADYNIHSEDLIRRYNENQVLQPRKPQPLMHVPEDLVLDIDSDREEEKAATHLSQLQPKSEAQLHPQMQPEAIRLGAGWYTLKELDDATNKFSDENVLGKGRNGTVYRGVLDDGTPIAIKNLLNNKGQAEEEFKAEVEVIGRVRHKHLVKLLGYCVEDECRMLVYEYVNNGNLDQWLHVNVAGDDSPLTWNTRMHIILGVAKGLAYLHEGLEPKVVHRDVKASNILLTENWVPKISDFGLARHLESGVSHITTRVMGTFGYVAPEYACTGMLNVKSDVYSFGVLIMEIISGRTPVDYRRPRDEIQLVEWLKDMIGDRRYEEVLDPKMPVKPCRKALKRALLVALQCVDPDSDERPSMGSVVHMLETDSILFSEEKGQSRRTFSSSSSTLSIEKKSPDIYAQNVDERLPHEWI